MSNGRTEFEVKELKKFRLFFKLTEADDADIEPEAKHELYDQYFKTAGEAKAYNSWLAIKKEELRANLAPEERTALDKRYWITKAALAAVSGPLDRVIPEPYDITMLRHGLSSLTFLNTANEVEKKATRVAGQSGFHPHIPMGYIVDPCDSKYTDGNVAFRLVPNTSILQATREPDWAHGTDNIMLPPMILSINLNVQHNAPQDWAKENAEEDEAIIRYLYSSDYSDEDDEDYEIGSLQDHAQLARKLARFSTPGRRFGKFGRPDPVSLSDHGDSGTHDLFDWEGNDILLPSTEVTGGTGGGKRRDRKADWSEDSNRSGTTLNDETGFAFYQLGALYYCSNMPDATTDKTEDIFAQEWFKTDYVVVAEVTRNGVLGPVWLLWNFWASREEGEPVWEQPHINFPDTERFFTAAKITDSFGDLRRDRELSIPTAQGEVFEKDFELVECFQTLGAAVVRQWVG